MASLKRRLKIHEDTESIPRYARIEIKLRPLRSSLLSSLSKNNEDEKKVYGSASCPKHPAVIPWYSLFYNGAGEDKYTLSSSDLSKPHIILHRLRRSKSETVSSIYYHYAHHHNLKVLLIIMSDAISQKELEEDHRLSDAIATKHIPLVIIPRGRNAELLDYLSEKRGYQFEATCKPLTIQEPNIIFPKTPKESITFKEIILDIIQNRTCVSTAISNGTRCMKWILENTIFLQNASLGEVAIGVDVLEEAIDLLSGDHFDAMFPQDFIFFFNFAYCLYNFSTQLSYDNDPKLNKLINKCVSKLLDLPPSHIMEHQMEFIKLGMFDILQSMGTKINIFELSAKSFVKLGDLFALDHLKDVAQANIIAVSISMRFTHYSSNKPVKKIQNLWQTKVVQKFQSQGMAPGDVASFKKGLNAMSIILNGHPELMLTWKDVSKIFTNVFHSIVLLRHFVKDCFDDLMQLNAEIIFVKDFFQPVTNFYHKNQSRLGKAPENTSIEECLNFLKDIVCNARKRHWDFSDNFSESLTKWVFTLVNIIDISQYDAKSLIELLFSYKDSLWINYEKNLNEQLKSKFFRQCEYLSLSEFVKIINLGDFDKSEIYKKFLSHVAQDDDDDDPNISVTTEPLKSLVYLSTSCLVPQEDFKEIMSFFQKLQTYYTQKDCLVDYLKDLLQVEIDSSDLFEEEFLEKFRDLLSTNTRQPIYTDFFEKFNELVVGEDRFHVAIMNVIIEETFVPTSNIIRALSTLLNAKPDLRELKNRSALRMFKITIEKIKLESIACLENDSEILSIIANSMSCIVLPGIIAVEEADTIVHLHTVHDLTETLPECADSITVIMNGFKKFLTNVHFFIENKEITFCHSQVLATHYDTYKRICDCASNYFREVGCLITKEEVLEAEVCVQKIQNLLVIVPENYPQLGGCQIENALEKYDIGLPVALENQIKKHLVPSSTGSFDRDCKPLPIHTYKARDESTLANLQSIAEQLEKFLQPISGSLDTLAFLVMNEDCKTLQKCINYFCDNPARQYTSPSTMPEFQDKRKLYAEGLRHNTSDPVDPESCDIDSRNKMINVNRAVKLMDEFMFALIEDCVLMLKVNEIFSYHSDFKPFDKDKWSDENHCLHDYYCKLKQNGDGTTIVDIKDSLLASFELKAAYQYIFAIQKTCEGFHLTKCLQDLLHTGIIDKVNYVKQTMETSVTTRDARNIMADIKEFLGVQDIIDNALFCLFVKLQEGHLDKLNTFAHDRGYDSVNGMRIFRQEYQLVTTTLLHEAHNEQLLSTLPNAMGLLFPFFKSPKNFMDLWSGVRQLSKLSETLSNLQFVTDGLGLIRTYFNRTHGENTETSLEAILSSGHYCFNFSKQKRVHMTLKFSVASSRGICGSDTFFDENSWSFDEINNFSQQLSFHNFEKESFDDIGSQRFDEFKKIATNLLNSYSQLQYHGHPNFTKPSVKFFPLNPPFMRANEAYGGRLLPSNWNGRWVGGWNEGHIQLTDEVKETKKLLNSFKQVSESNRHKYCLLSFLSSSKLNFLYEKLSEEYLDIGTIINEIGFLFSLNINSILSLKKHLTSINPVFTLDQHPAEVVGCFMEKLVNDSDSNLKSHLNTVVSCLSCGSAKSGPLIFYLISALEYTNRDLMDLILWIFEKIPFYFQLLRCSSVTTEEDIQLFFDRIELLHEQKYLIMGVDLLRNELQRVLLRRCSKLRPSNLHEKTKELNLYLVEYSSSLFRHIPWIKNTTINIPFSGKEFDKIKSQCKKQRTGQQFRKFEVVYGSSGCGKTFYIKERIRCHEKEYSQTDTSSHNKGKPHKAISINETFNRSDILNTLSSVLLHRFDMLYYFNISLFLPHESDKQDLKDNFNKLVDDVNWFFFDLFVLGYVEIAGTSIPSSNYSLCLPTCIATSVYIEVPYWNINGKVEDSFKKFNDLFPSLAFLGEKVLPKKEFDTKQYDGAQLVCKYLEANRLDILFSERLESAAPVQIETVDKRNLSPEKCSSILERHFPQSVKGSKILESLYLKYMERRCKSLEKCFILSYLDDCTYHEMRDEDNELIEDFNPKNMRSTLFEIMKEEALDFCSSSVLDDTDKHQQVVYDIDETGGVVFKFFCTGQPTDEKLLKLKAIGVKLKPMTAQWFHSCLSAALNVRMDDKSKLIPLIKKKKFVLTKDFVRKMLIINERRECGVPVVIEGETGVGKTYLLDFLSSLWNDSWNQHLKYLRDKIKSNMSLLVSKMMTTKRDPHAGNLILKVQSVLDNDEKLSYDLLCRILSIKEFQGFLYYELKKILLSCAYNPVIANIKLESHSDKEMMDYLHQLEEYSLHVQAMANVIYGILNCTLKEIFYKMSLHAATTPEEIKDFLLPIDQHANLLLSRYDKYLSRKYNKSSHCYQKPIITVFFDEINTCSCPGYIKEILIDKTVNGIPLAENLFIVAACNPHRGNSLATQTKPDDEWLNSSYYVQSLPHTLNILKWNYKQLKPEDEKEYIREMFHLLYEDKDLQEYDFLTSLIAQAQNLVREYALKNLVNLLPACDPPKTHSIFEEPTQPVNPKAKIFSESTVSQRDIQRVFKLYDWLENWFKKTTKYANEELFHISVRALYVSLALVYYLRLNETDRNDFKNKICIECLVGTIPPTFEQALADELAWVGRVFELPKGVAPTEALKENIYAILICTMVCIPVLIVGPPGSSKTLSFRIVVDNCQGTESKHKELRDLSTFKYLDPHPYQCSRKSTSTEIETVFERAINRQNTSDSDRTRMLAVVLMDEAGLTESSHESMKVLHHLLDDPKVSFVGISNDVLDAAKTNRMVVVYRSEISSSDLLQLAKHSMSMGKFERYQNQGEEQVITSLVKIYENLMNKSQFGKFFGLRDFIHFFTYLGQSKVNTNDMVKPQSIMEALEHNFNGTADFEDIVKKFFQAIGSREENLQKRSIVEILQSSFHCKERDLTSKNETRYKLFIDSSEDQSLVRLLFQFGVMKREETSIHSCSRFPCEAESQKLYTTAAIRHAATEGNTTLIYQAEEIQECFYDLFNQWFICIPNPATGEKLLYANVAIGTVIKPTRVGLSFNCAVILSDSEKSRTKKPFLNRFEKYNLSHRVIFTQILLSLQDHIKSIMINAKNKVEEFVNKCGKTSFYGLVDQTVDSLMLSVAPQHKPSSDEMRETELASIDLKNCHCKLELLAKCLQVCFHLEYGVYIDVGQKIAAFSDAVKYASGTIPREQIIDDFIESMNFQDIKILADCTVKASEVSLECPQSIYNFSILLLQELLIVHLHHKLLQLMTPEALVICNGSDANYSMDRYYTESYLYSQHHFSLGNLINNECDNKAPVQSKKFLCYLRTSQAIIEIIPNHFTYQANQCTKDEIESLQKFLTLKASRRLHTYVMNSSTSQEILILVLRHFFQCPQSESEILLLVADMNELSKETINHARILIEEAECSSCYSNKLVFLVLHFPPNMFYNHCYPTLFLNGWSHIYIGRAGEMTKDSFIDIEKWLITCLLQKDDIAASEDSFANDDILIEWLCDSTVHCSRSVIMKQLKDFPPVDCDIETIRFYFTRILLNASISTVIRKRFRKFWQQEAMLTLTFQIAQYAMSYHSSCSLSQTVQETIQSSFTEFTVLFLCIMNERLTIHTLLCEEDQDPDKDSKFNLAANMLSVLPIPNSLKQLQVDVRLHITQQLHAKGDMETSSPRFPFSILVSDAIDDIINRAFRENRDSIIDDQQQDDPSSPINDPHHDQSDFIINRSVDLLNEQFMGEDGNVVQVAVKAIEDNPQFWEHYMNDVMSRSLTRDIGTFSKTFFSRMTATILTVGNVVEKLVTLHYNLHMYWLDSQQLSTLRLLDECVNGNADSPVDLKDELSVLVTSINTLYTSLVDIQSTLEDSYLTKVDKLSRLYYQMVTKSHSPFEDLSVPVKIKWMILAIVFHLYSMTDSSFSIQLRQFVLKLKRLVDNNPTYLKANVLADEVAYKTWHTNEVIIEHYVNHFYELLRDEEIDWMCCFIDKVESLTPSDHPDCHQLKSKYRHHFKTLLGVSVHTLVSSDMDRNTTHPNPLLLFDDRVRLRLATLIDSCSSCDCFVYHPPGIRNCSTLIPNNENVLEVPICNAYYELVLKRLYRYQLSGMIKVYNEIVGRMKNSVTCESIKKILAIEKQAIIQNIIEKLAREVVTNTDHEITSIDELNIILDDCNACSRYRENVKDNALVLMMRLLQVYRSEGELQVKLVDNFNVVTLLTGFNCLTSIHDAIKTQSLPSEHFLPFLSNFCSNRLKIYKDVFAAIKGIINRVKKGTSSLHRLGLTCYSPTDKTGLKKWTFNMSVFLSVYAESVLRKRVLTAGISQKLREEVFQYLGEEYYQFVDWIINGIERNLEVREFFIHNKTHGQCLVELVAVVLGSPEKSSHFWGLLFNWDSYFLMPGSTITGDYWKEQYADMTVLNEESLTFTYRQSLNFQSLVVLQWVNYALQCVSAFVHSNWDAQIVTEERLREFPEPQEALHELNMLWDKIGQACNLSSDERDTLLFACVQNIFKVLGTTHTLSALREYWTILTGKGSSIEEQDRIECYQALCQYEQIIHNQVFLPAWESVKSEKGYTRFGDPIAGHMRDLKRNVPQLSIKCEDPMKGFLQIVLTSTNLHDSNCRLFTLYQFILTRPTLNIGVVVLPKLVELYCLIHNKLQYKVTARDAQTHTVEEIFEKLLDQYYPKQKNDKMSQMNEIIREYNHYRRSFTPLKLPEINLDMKFCDLLHVESHTVNSRDVLCKAITDIVKRYNDFLKRHRPITSTDDQGRFIPLREVTIESCIFTKHKNFDELLSYRNLSDIRRTVMKYCSLTRTAVRCKSDPTMVQDCIPEVFDFDMIQEDIVKMFIAHKQEIDDTKGFWKPFDFYNSQYDQIPQNMLCSSAHYKDIIGIIERNYEILIREEFTHFTHDKECQIVAIIDESDDNTVYVNRVPSDNDDPTIEETFHSLNYDTLVSLCSGLYLLLQMIVQKAPFCDLREIVDQTIVTFLTNCRVRQQAGDVLEDIGIKRQTAGNVRSGLDDYHYKIICDIRIDTVVHQLRFLQNWLEIGYYDFYHLPFCMKIRIDQDDLLLLHEWLEDNDNDKIVTDIMNYLFMSEQAILKAANDNCNTKISEVLVINKTADIIPQCIQRLHVEHYVYVHLELREWLMNRTSDKRKEQTLAVMAIETSPSSLPPSQPPSLPEPPKKRETLIVYKAPRTPPNEEQPAKQTDYLLEIAKTKTSQEVVEFLKSNGFEKSAIEAEEDEDMNGEYVYECLSSDETLNDNLLLESCIERLRFRILFKRWLSGTISELGKVCPERVAELFAAHRRLAQYSQAIIDKRIDGEILKEANINAMADIGIDRPNCTIVRKVVRNIEDKIVNSLSEPLSNKGEVSEKQEKGSTCPVCLYNRTDLHQLPCLHTICQDCFQHLTVLQQLTSCPICRNSLKSDP